MKKILSISLAVIFCVTISAPSVMAGSRGYSRGGHYHSRDHHSTGARIAVGVGAAILGGAILHSMLYPYRTERVTYVRETCPPPVYYEPACPPPSAGHWEVRKTWVEPVYERVWNPPHYNQNNDWVPGQWIEIEKSPGYWREERVWVSGR